MLCRIVDSQTILKWHNKYHQQKRNYREIVLVHVLKRTLAIPKSNWVTHKEITLLYYSPMN